MTTVEETAPHTDLELGITANSPRNGRLAGRTVSNDTTSENNSSNRTILYAITCCFIACLVIGIPLWSIFPSGSGERTIGMAFTVLPMIMTLGGLCAVVNKVADIFLTRC